MCDEYTIKRENCIELSYKGKRKHIVMQNVPKISYPGQTITVEISRGSSDTTMVREMQQYTFNLDLVLKGQGKKHG